MSEENKNQELLFDTKPFFQKERPKEPTIDQVNNFYKKKAKEIINSGFSTSRKKDIISDLKMLYPFRDSGFEMAKSLDGLLAEGSYDITVFFMEWLESLSWEYGKMNDKNIKEWVKSHNPKPLFQKGQSLLVKEKLGNLRPNGVTVYVNGIKEDTAHYLIDEDPERKGGTVYDYEFIEQRCVKSS